MLRVLPGADLEPSLGSGRHAVTGGTQHRCFDRHDVIYNCGDDAPCFYELESGVVSIDLYMKDGRRQLAELIFPGDIFGFTLEGTYADTAVALQVSAVRVMRVAELRQSQPACLDVISRLGRQLKVSHHHVLAMGRKTAEQRVCHLLWRLARAQPAAEGERPGIIPLQVPLTRGEMGDYLGLSLETVCRTMTCLQRKRLIEVGPRQRDVTLLQPNALRAMAG